MTWNGYDQFDITKAAYQSDTRTLRKLIDSGADVNIKGTNGYTALFWATRSMSEGEQIRQTVRILLEAGADPNMKNDADETPLYLATYYGEIEAAEELLAFGGDINDVFIGLLDNKIVALATKYESQLTENNRKTWKKKPRGTISIKTGINE